MFAYVRPRGITDIARVRTKVHVFTGMPHLFLVYDILSAKVGAIRLLESIRWGLADGDGQVGDAWNAEPAK